MALFGRFGLLKGINRKYIPSGIIYEKETQFQQT